jgi:hypothetical protein
MAKQEQSNYELGQEILRKMRGQREAKQMDVSLLVQDLDWSQDSAPQLQIYFCESSGLVSMRLHVARDEPHRDDIALSEGDSRETIKDMLEGYIDLFTTALKSMEKQP